MNRYVAVRLHKDIDQHVTAAHGLFDGERLLGLITLANAGVSKKDVPRSGAKRLGLAQSYAILPATLIGRLAVDREFHGMGFGRRLIAEALELIAVYAKSIGTALVVVDPKNDPARALYVRLGFRSLRADERMYFGTRGIGLRE